MIKTIQMEKKKTGKIKKRFRSNNKTIPMDQKLRALKVLEQCDMNVTEAAKITGISRISMSKYKNELWAVYLQNKEQVREQALTIEATKKDLAKNIDRIVEDMDDLMGFTIDKIQERILKDEFYTDNFGNRHYIVTTKDLVQLVNVLSPYLADKRGVKGIDEKAPETGISTFMQNIRNAMLQRKQINENNIEEGQADDISSENKL